MSATRGIVYVATKDERYAAEAFLSATSAKDLMPEIPITLYTNLPQSVFVNDRCFDNVVPIDTVRQYQSSWAEGQLDRLMCLPRSPYDYTLHLDTDTRVMSRDVLQIFSELETSDIAMVECHVDNSFSRYHYNARMFNVGFILYKRSTKTSALFDAWTTLTARHFAAASAAEPPFFPYLAHISDPELRARLLFMDQVSLVQLCSPDVNVFDLRVKILHESWNYRGSEASRTLDQAIKINHHPALRGVLTNDILQVAQRYQRNGNLRRALALYEFLDSAAPANHALQSLIKGCRDGIADHSSNQTSITEVRLADLVDQVKQSATSGNLALAERICRDVIEVQPGEPTFLALLGSVLLDGGRSPEGITFAERALAIAPRNAGLHALKGLLLRALNRNQEAAASFHEALRLMPSLARAHLELGDLARTRLAYGEAAEYFRRAAELEPNNFVPFVALGDTLLQLERFDESIETYRTAIRLGPSKAMAGTQRNLGVALRQTGQYEEALECLATAADQDGSHATILECLLHLTRYDEFFSFLALNLEADSKNLSIAAISAYASQQLGRNDPHPFCPSPLEHIHILPDLGLKDTCTALDIVTTLISAYDDCEVFWEPITNSVVKGYSSAGNIFGRANPVFSELRKIVLAEADKYRQFIKPESIEMSRSWPSIPRLHGWYIRLSTGGYSQPHIHPQGWLSGVIYLRLPKTTNVDEGAIEFGLASPRFPRISGDSPRLVHRPVVGELILFPSSLFHRTIPFSGVGEERISLSFDLGP